MKPRIRKYREGWFVVGGLDRRGGYVTAWDFTIAGAWSEFWLCYLTHGKPYSITDGEAA